MCLGSANKAQAKGTWVLLLQGHLSEAGGSPQVQQTTLLPPDWLLNGVLCLWRWSLEKQPWLSRGFVCDMLPVSLAA